MIIHYIKIALRNLYKQKLFTLINILGLAVGMTGFAFFALTSGIKLNADKFHKNSQDIYTIVQVMEKDNKEKHTTFIPLTAGQMLQNEWPDLKKVRIIPKSGLLFKEKTRQFFEQNVLFTDPNFLTFFSYKMLTGEPETALIDPHCIVLSKTAAIKYFGKQNPIGKTLSLENKIDLTVTGVVQDIPKTSSLKFEFLIPIKSRNALTSNSQDQEPVNCTTFIRTNSEISREQIENRLSFLFKTHFLKEYEKSNVYLFPLQDFRLNGSHIESCLSSSNKTSVVILLLIGSLLLLIVSINFITLSIARYMQRTKEISVRKIVGAGQFALFRQFMGESLLISLIALPLALVLFELVSPTLFAYIGTPSHLKIAHSHYSITNYPFLLKYMVITSVIVGLFTGFYPSIILSKMSIKALFENKKAKTKSNKTPTKILIMFQFILSIMIIAFSGIAKNQYNNIINADFGFERKNLAAIKVDGLSESKKEIVKTELGRLPFVENITACKELPDMWTNPKSVYVNGTDKQNALLIEMYGVDQNFIKTVKINLEQGYRFDKNLTRKNSFLINKSAVKKLGLKNPLGQELIADGKSGIITGVVDDFILADIGFEIPPAILYLQKSNLNYILFRHANEIPFRDIEKKIEKIWNNLIPNVPCKCVSIEETFLDSMGMIKRISVFLQIIGIVCILFSSLGLFGLTSLLIEHRTKEIGIRKVLGATFLQISWTVSKNFISIILIANLTGIIFVYVIWQSILKTGLLFLSNNNSNVFIIAVVISFITALTAISSQIIKTVKKNPIHSLKYE